MCVCVCARARACVCICVREHVCVSAIVCLRTNAHSSVRGYVYILLYAYT